MSFEGVKKQIAGNPVKLARYLKFNKTKDRKFGRNTHRCRKCNNTRGVIRKYGILYCRRCFREDAKGLGFTKYH